jgi:hypothetical protein
MEIKPRLLSSICRKGLPTLAVLSLLLVPSQSKADTIYSTLSAYNAATAGNTTITFNGIASPGSYVQQTSPFTLSGATFSSTSSLFIIDPAYYGFSYAEGGFLSGDYQTPDVITVTLPSVTAVGFDYGGLLGTTGSFMVTLSDGFTTTLSTTDSTADGSLSFAGFTSATPLTSITLTLPDAPNYNAIDNFVYGQSGVVPEPASLALMLTGLIGAAGIVRRRFQQ